MITQAKTTKSEPIRGHERPPNDNETISKMLSIDRIVPSSKHNDTMQSELGEQTLRISLSQYTEEGILINQPGLIQS